MDTLFLIPARGGSKGIPYKNIKLLGGKPLITYAIDLARKFSTDEHICVSTDDAQIINTVENHGLKVPFVRPAHLATDTATTDDVLLHALDFYENKGITYKKLVLLQPTSPFRQVNHLQEALALYEQASREVEMLVSVFETEANPYYLLAEENKDGFLEKSKKIPQGITRRQDVPKVWQYNGAIYVISVAAFRQKKQLGLFDKVTKYEMDKLHSLDIDVPLDWLYAEFLVEKKIITL
jgi:N-acylneuraminate cytidylyltransferase